MAEDKIHTYQGKIRSVCEDHGDSCNYNTRAAINFIPSEGEVKGLSIFIIYKFGSDEKKDSFINDLESRLGTSYDKPCSKKNVLAEVYLTEKITKMCAEYEASSSIRFIDKEEDKW